MYKTTDNTFPQAYAVNATTNNSIPVSTGLTQGVITTELTIENVINTRHFLNFKTLIWEEPLKCISSYEYEGILTNDTLKSKITSIEFISAFAFLAGSTFDLWGYR